MHGFGPWAVASFWCALAAVATGSLCISTAARNSASPLLRALERGRSYLAGDAASFEGRSTSPHR